MGVWGWWAFDIFTLIASYLATEVISAQTIMRSLGLLTFMIPVGFSKACSYYVGVFIGKGSEESIMHYYKVSMTMSCVVGLIQVIILWSIREYIINMYTTQEEVQEQMRYAWSVFLIFVFFDTTQGIGSSAIKASGRQKAGALITGMSYWAVGIPITCLLVFWQTMGIKGIWVGPTAACILITFAYHIIVMNSDWQSIIEENHKSQKKDKKIEEEENDNFKEV